MLRPLLWDPVDCMTMSVIAAWCLVLETLLRFNGRSMQRLLRGRLGLLHGLWLALLPAGSASEPDIVRLANGALLRGHLGNGYRLFRAVPYAEAPTGVHRWQPPRPKAPWPGVLDTSLKRACPRCPQNHDETFHTNEDCLVRGVEV